MKLTLSLPFALTLAVLAPLAAPGRQVAAAEVPQEPEAAAPPADQSPEFLLRYKFAPGETIRWRVVHLGTTETKISGNTQTSRRGASPRSSGRCRKSLPAVM